MNVIISLAKQDAKFSSPHEPRMCNRTMKYRKNYTKIIITPHRIIFQIQKDLIFIPKMHVCIMFGSVLYISDELFDSKINNENGTQIAIATSWRNVSNFT